MASSSAARKNDGSVDRDPDAGARGRTTRPPSAAPPITARVLTRDGGARSPAGASRGTVCGTIPIAAGKKKAELSPLIAPRSSQLPDLRLPGQEEDGDRALAEAADDVRDDHDAVTWEPVGPDPADEQEQDLRDRARREDEAEVGLRAGQVENGERERDVRERAADDRRRPPEEQEPEAPLAERAEGLAEVHGEILAYASDAVQKMEPRGIEPLTSRVPLWRSPS